MTSTPKPIEVRILFFVDRNGKPRARVQYNGARGEVRSTLGGVAVVHCVASVFEAQACEASKGSGASDHAETRPLTTHDDNVLWWNLLEVDDDPR